MSTPNPLAPQGSLLEKQGRGRSTFQIIGFIGALHVFVLCAFLWIGCKQDKPAVGGGGPDSGLPGQDAGLPPVTEPPAIADPGSTNPVVAPSTNPPSFPAPGVGVAVGAPPVAGPGPGNPPVTTPTPPPTVPPVAVPGPGSEAGAAPASEHKVAQSETGAVIAKKYGVSVKALTAANPNVNWNRLKIGQVLAIPAPAAKAADAPAPGAPAGAAAGGSATGGTTEGGATYTVRPGDTGSKIAKKVGVAWRKIRDLNGLSSDNLKPGQKLNIPAKGAASAPAGGDAPVPAAPTVPDSAVPVVRPLPSTGGR